VVLEPDPEVEPEEPLLLEPLLPIELPLESPLLLELFLCFLCLVVVWPDWSVPLDWPMPDELWFELPD
jgi:hypothetical protein